MNIGHAIRYLRKRKGWTQQQLADFSNTSKSNISNLENGNQGYSPAILQYLAEAFNCTVAQLFLLAESLDDDENIADEIHKDQNRLAKQRERETRCWVGNGKVLKPPTFALLLTVLPVHK